MSNKKSKIVGRLLTATEADTASGGQNHSQGGNYNQSGGGNYTQNTGGTHYQSGGGSYTQSNRPPTAEH